MKKKIFIASAVIVVIFLIFLILSVRANKKQSQPINQEQATQTTQDDLTAADAISAVYEKYPWYGKIPIVTDDFTIAFNFEKDSFRIIFLKPSTEDIKQSALGAIENIGADLDQYSYYFIEPEPGFQQLLP